MVGTQSLRKLRGLIKGRKEVFICHPMSMCNMENGDGQLYQVNDIPSDWLDRWCENYWIEDGDLCIIFKGDNRR